jgi:phosphatidylglycerophosphatase A
MINKLIKLYLTGFNIGCLKYMPGTFGTLLAIPIYILISNNSLYLNLLLIFSLFFLSIFLLNLSYNKSIFNHIDDKSIVIDEIIGYLSFMIFFPPTVANILIGFLLFRFFDIIKPFPIYLIDKRMKNSFGVIFDDIIAAIFAGIILYIIINVF